MTSPTTITAPFDLALAKLGWPIVTRDGRAASVITWENQLVNLWDNHAYPVLAAVNGVKMQYTEEGKWYHDGVQYADDLLLLLDLTSPAYRLAVQRAHEELGEEVWNRRNDDPTAPWCKTPEWPAWYWDTLDYAILRHLPYFQNQTKEGGEK